MLAIFPMTRAAWSAACTAWLAAALLHVATGPALAQYAASVTAQPPSTDPTVQRFFIDPAANRQPPFAEMTQLLRSRIKYVFVIFNENQSFDHEYGTFPGVDGVYSDGHAPRSAADTPGFSQSYVDSFTGQSVTVHPFRLGPEHNGSVVDSVDHSHAGLAAKLAVTDGAARMTGFAQDEFTGKATTLANEARGRQFANIVMSHIDCDTIPFYWLYASRFAIFDNIFATEDTPSTPNAVAMIAGQAGETQWVKHGSADGQMGPTQAPPLLNDPQPYWGSPLDTVSTPANRQPAGAKENYAGTNIASNLTFASIPLTAMGPDIRSVLEADTNAGADQADVRQDIAAIAAGGTPTVAWRWYQNGYDHEESDGGAPATHAAYISHHQGPQYFGYVANTAAANANLRGETDFFTDLAAGALPARGGIIYIRGGYLNNQGLVPPIQNPNYPRALTPADIAAIQMVKAGDDDHPSYSDRQITEAMNARVINAIAADPKLWAQSAIIITYDESDGFYDHVPPRFLSYGPDGLPLSRGIRVPLLVISPYARSHVVSHAEGDHNAIIETINQIFGLPALSSLPDEAQALTAGNTPRFNRFAPTGFEQTFLGPRDTNSAITDSLASAFDPQRLRGTAPPLPPSYAIIPEAVVTKLPHYGGEGCRAIGVKPVTPMGTADFGPPAAFNPLAATLPQYNSPAP